MRNSTASKPPAKREYEAGTMGRQEHRHQESSRRVKAES
jgi:hypothetical protein